jgi:ABC-type antimicrobial peptide transport system ATPase subunit
MMSPAGGIPRPEGRALSLEVAEKPVAQMHDGHPLLRVENLQMYFPIYKGILRRRIGAVQAVDGISFDIRKGETLALVGESGMRQVDDRPRRCCAWYEPTGGTVRIGCSRTSMSPR